ncbi:MAG: trehalose-phosphatase [Candidatus Omnitrophota bacterium]
MKYLFSGLGKIEKDLKDKFIYLFLDYDGTLAPIARTPDRAILPKRTKELLRRLSEMPDCKIAIVSGRTLGDISRRVGLKNIVYVGNHGFEIKGPKIDFKSPVPVQYRKTLEEIRAKLEKSLSSIGGVFIEDKGFSLSVHYRLADKKRVPAVKAEFYTVVLLYELKNSVRVKPGKMVLEVRPPISWDKGKVVLRLLGRRFPIYIGDDVTDEDAFESLKNKGITISVGKPKNTKARFYLKDTKEVAEFLGILWRKKR